LKRAPFQDWSFEASGEIGNERFIAITQETTSTLSQCRSFWAQFEVFELMKLILVHEPVLAIKAPQDWSPDKQGGRQSTRPLDHNIPEVVSKYSIGLKVKAGQKVQPQEYMKYFAG